MHVARLLNTPCTITHVGAGAPDDYNDPTETTTTTTSKCWLWQEAASEDTVGTDQQTTRFNMALLPDAAVTGRDRVTVNGETYSVDGPPWEATHPRTLQVTHIECRVVKVS